MLNGVPSSDDPTGNLHGAQRRTFRAPRLWTVLIVSTIVLAAPLTAQRNAAAQSGRECLLFPCDVITPAGRLQPPSRSPSTIAVITAENIRRSGATNLPDLLRTVPGLDIFRVSASDVNVTARGLNSRLAHRMQVYIDGRSVYEDFLNLVFWHELPISLQEIERIEIVRSPISALYGANAFSGVIHIITKTPESLKGTQVTETAGNAGTNIASVIHAGAFDRWSYKFSFEHDRTNHYPNSLINRSNNDKGREDFRGNIFGEYKFNEARLSFSAGMDAFDRDLDPGLVPSPAPPTRVFANGGLGFVKLNYAWNDFRAQLAWDRLDMDLRSTILSEEVPVLANTFKFDAQHSLHLGAQNILTGGVSYRYHMFDSDFLIGRERRQNLFSVFVQNEYSPIEDLTFTAGVRVDTHPQAGVTVAPRGSVVYAPWRNHSLRASISRAFRNPSVLENFVNFEILTAGGPIAVRGDRDLKPEEITSFELGYQGLFFDQLKLHLDLFYNRLHRMSVGTASVDGAVRVLGGGGGSIYGGEAGIEYVFNPSLRGFANYSFQERRVDDNVLGVGPRHKGNVGLSLTIGKKFETDMFLSVVGRSDGSPGGVDPYSQFNLRLGYPFEWNGAKGSLSLAAFNLFNDKHREFRGGDLIERRIVGALKLRF